MSHMFLNPRLRATLRTDILLQYRNGFYYVTLFILGLWAVMVSQVPSLDLGWLIPAIIVSNLVVSTFYFISGLVLLEKGEGTLQSQVVTPLRSGEYLASKLITLIVLTLFENLVMVVLLVGYHINLLALSAGILACALLFTLAGFITVARYDSINEFLLPSVLYCILLGLPMLTYLGGWQSWLLYLHPMQGALVLMQAAFQPMPLWSYLYGIGYSLLWGALFYRMSLRAFDRYIIDREGENGHVNA